MRNSRNAAVQRGEICHKRRAVDWRTAPGSGPRAAPSSAEQSGANSVAGAVASSSAKAAPLGIPMQEQFHSAGRPARRSPTSRMSCRCRIPAAFKPSKPRVRCSPPEQTSSKTRKSSVRRPAGGIFPERRRSWPENRRWWRPVRCIRASRSRPARARSARLRCSSSDLRRAHNCW